MSTEVPQQSSDLDPVTYKELFAAEVERGMGRALVAPARLPPRDRGGRPGGESSC